MPTPRALVNTLAAAAVIAVSTGAVAPLASPALAAPSHSAQHPPTFVINCAGLGPVTSHESTGAAGFVFESPTPGVTYVVISTEGTLYAGTEPAGEVIGSFSRAWGTRAGMDRITCTRVNTDLIDGQAFTVSEVFVLAVVPRQ